VQRVTVTLDEELVAALDAFAETRGVGSRSEALRDLVRDGLKRQALESAPQPSYATLSYVYDHGTRDLARRLTQSQHDHHDLTIASLHVHLDHARCLEVAVLRGSSDRVRRLADDMIGQRGVRYGQLALIPDESAAGSPHHGRERQEPEFEAR
jgi:CopG family nickel-responsive transcriptional regulator